MMVTNEVLKARGQVIHRRLFPSSVGCIGLPLLRPSKNRHGAG